jgi:hypothetical protein
MIERSIAKNGAGHMFFMKKHLIKLSTIATGIALPAIVFAQGNLTFITTLQNIVTGFGTIVRMLLPIVFALAILAFFYGIFVYVFGHATESKKNGRDIMLWSLVAIFVMASLYGIVSLLQTNFGVSGSGQFQTGQTQPVQGLP